MLFLKQGLSLQEKDFLSNFGAVCFFLLEKNVCWILHRQTLVLIGEATKGLITHLSSQTIPESRMITK